MYLVPYQNLFFYACGIVINLHVQAFTQRVKKKKKKKRKKEKEEGGGGEIRRKMFE